MNERERLARKAAERGQVPCPHCHQGVLVGILGDARVDPEVEAFMTLLEHFNAQGRFLLLSAQEGAARLVDGSGIGMVPPEESELD